jgi:hypothetical protein
MYGGSSIFSGSESEGTIIGSVMVAMHRSKNGAHDCDSPCSYKWATSRLNPEYWGRQRSIQG